MKTFKQLAADLSKPGDEIAALITAQEAHLWHMATGFRAKLVNFLTP